ncbi:DNA gyrase C-terminal beta-propeller domain-containing protein, partial [Pseudoclavibacter helvolus]
DISDYRQAQYLVLATREGLVKKTALTEYDTNRQAGIIAVNLREGDELVSAMLADESDHVFCVSHLGMSLRFEANDEALRPMGRSTSGVKGMSFRDGDYLLTAAVTSSDDAYVFIVTEGGYAKRTSVSQYRIQKRGGLGIKVAKLNEERGGLAGALLVHDDEEVLVILGSGKVVRSNVAEVSVTGRDSMGVTFARLDNSDYVIAIAQNADRELEKDDEDAEGDETAESATETALETSTGGESTPAESAPSETVADSVTSFEQDETED